MRKFFSLSLGLLFIASIPTNCFAQCVERTISVSRVQGAVFDSFGQPIPNAGVSLEQDGKAIASLTTNESGGFFISANSGNYEFHAKARGFEPYLARINLRTDLIRAAKPTHIWMILKVGSAQVDSCDGFTTTSRRQFEKAIQRQQRN
ncbi:MAG: carboxypeptidase-like regulatory domain-containing protein [Terracidiphilus sp.]